MASASKTLRTLKQTNIIIIELWKENKEKNIEIWFSSDLAVYCWSFDWEVQETRE